MASSDFKTMVAAYIEYSLDCATGAPATWVDMCAETSEIDISGLERDVATRAIFCSGGTISVLGNKTPAEISAVVLYSEEATSPAWDAIWTAFETLAGSCEFGIRWAPLGNTAGNDRFTACGVLKAFPPPVGGADGSEVITSTLVMESNEVSRDVIP